jgi:hypothetical protein
MEYSPAIQQMKEYHESKGGKFFKKTSKNVKRQIIQYNYGRYIIESRTNKVSGMTHYDVYQFEIPCGEFILTEGINFKSLHDAVNYCMKVKADRNEDSLWPYGNSNE